MALEIGGLVRDLNFVSPHDSEDSELYRKVKAEVRTVTAGWSEDAAQSDDGVLDRIKKLYYGACPEKQRITRLVYQEGFRALFEQLREEVHTPSQVEQANLFINNCLTFFVFANLTPHEFIEIPQYIGGEWQLVSYKVAPIELTATSGPDRLALNEGDRVFAYGLEPIASPNATPHLVFMGTALDGGQGLPMQLITDFEAFESPGKAQYRSGHKRITAFLDKQCAQGKKTQVCGMSLGGALSLLLAIDQGHKLSRVDVLNPPGLHQPFFNKSRYDHWDEIVARGEAPPVYIQKNYMDFVSKFGYWKQGFCVLTARPPEGKGAPTSFNDHLVTYAALKDTVYEETCPMQDNSLRWWSNIGMHTALRTAIYYLLALPLQYVVRPVINYVIKHFVELALIAVAILLIPHLVLPAAIALALVVSVPALSLLYSTIADVTFALCGVDSEPLNSHRLDAPRNKILDMHKSEISGCYKVSDVEAYHARYGLFKQEEQLENGRIRVTDSKAKLYDLEQVITHSNMPGKTPLEREELIEEAHQALYI